MYRTESCDPTNAPADASTRYRRALRKNKLDKRNAIATVQPLFMKNNPFAATLVCLLFISAAISATFAIRYGFWTRDARRLQPRVMAINNTLALAQSLLNDTLEYSKHNPAIDPLLQSLNMKTNPVPGAAASPPPAR